MRRRLLTVACVLALTAAQGAAAAEIEVAGGGPSLGEAILLAEPGDTIVLPPGRFVLTQGEVLEEKDLTLRGAGETETTVIPGGGGEALEDPGVSYEELRVGPAQQPLTEDAGEEESNGGISGKAQVIALLVTGAIFLFILDLVRRRRLAERYALLWMSAGLALLVLSIWTDGLNVLADAMGVQEPANAIFILAFAVGFLLLLNFSVASSRLSEETKILAQEVARLGEELSRDHPEGSATRATEQGDDDSPVTAQSGSEDA